MVDPEQGDALTRPCAALTLSWTIAVTADRGWP